MSPDRPRRRLAISLRVFLLLILAFGLWLGWEVNRARDQRLAVAAIRQYGGFAHYDWEFAGGKVGPGRQPDAPGWLRRLLGDDYFQRVARVSLVYDDSTGKRYETARTDDGVLAHLRGMDGLKELLLKEGQATDAGLAHIRGLTGLEGLWMWDARDLTDDGVAQLAGLRSLKTLHISNSKLTDRGLGHLAGLAGLEQLSIQGTAITDEGLARIRGLRNLKGLHIGLGDCRVTDAGLEHLMGMSHLQVLDLQGSRVTDRGLERLGRLPALKEVWLGDATGRITPAGIERLKAMKSGLIIR